MNPPALGSPRFSAASWMRMSLALGGSNALPDRDTPIGALTHDFFTNNWANAQALLARSKCLRVFREPSPAPHVFGFEFDRPYKRKRSELGIVVLAPGPIRGFLCYATDPFTADPALPAAVVFIESDGGFFHPNYSHRMGGVLCLGNLPAGPQPLDFLLEHIYRIVTYQNRSTSSALDSEAARYFAEDPHALDGLVPVEPLY